MYQDIAYPYIENTITQNTLPIPLSEIKEYLKLNSNNNVVDNELTLMMNTAIEYAEKYSRQYFTKKTVTTNRCFWGEIRNNNFMNSFTLRRCPLISVTSIKYLNEDEEEVTLSPDNYRVTKINNGYSRITFKGDLPEVCEDLFPIEITFVAGREQLPNDIKTAILQHIASMWLNRGDCDNDDYNKCPKICKDIYKKYKIIEVGA